MKYPTLLTIYIPLVLLLTSFSFTAFGQSGKCVSGDCYNGTGVYVWPTNDKYNGQFVNGRITGQGTYTWANGTVYTGGWKENRQHGIGTLTLSNGNKKSGQWANGNYVGAASASSTASSSTSTKKTGCVRGDCFDGDGMYKWPDGSSYEGNFSGGVISGQGTYRWADGSNYKGAWRDGRRNGQGTYITAAGERKTGNWENDVMTKLERPATAPTKNPPYASSSSRPTSSNSNSSKPSTSSSSQNKNCVTGNCQNGIGKMVFGPKENYEGSFQNAKFHGHGTYKWADGSKYTGEWKYGKRDGKGTYYFPNLSKKAGIWSKGVFVREVKGQETTVTTITRNTDTNPPRIKVTSPASVSRGISITVKEREVLVKGTVTDETGIKSVRVSGASARLTNPGSKTSGFGAKVNLSPGQNKFWVEATDMKGNSDKMEFTLIYESAPRDVQQYTSTGEARTALVIGNGNYEFAKLPNATNDSDSLAKELRGLGFDVIHHNDIALQEMEEAINDFGEKLKQRGGVGLIFYAGHGIQIEGENYLIPLGASIKKEKDIKYKSVHLGYLLDELETANNGMNVVVLDACRDNPYAAKYRSLKNGLAGIAVAPVGTYVAYATSPGSAASDGSGTNGLYTQELLKALRISGLKIEDVFKIVRANVRKASKGQQVPWDNSSLEGDFYFRR